MRNTAIAILIFLCFIAMPAWASLTLTTDNRSVDFGQMKLDEEKELLYMGTYHNEITCTSSNGNLWYLKVNLLKPFSSGANLIPNESFKWQLDYTDGKGTLTSPYIYKSFSLSPDTLYMSGPGDASGTPVHLRLKYSLKIPDAQPQGIYNTVIRFTLTELL